MWWTWLQVSKKGFRKNFKSSYTRSEDFLRTALKILHKSINVFDWAKYVVWAVSLQCAPVQYLDRRTCNVKWGNLTQSCHANFFFAAWYKSRTCTHLQESVWYNIIKSDWMVLGKPPITFILDQFIKAELIKLPDEILELFLNALYIVET